MKKRSSGIKPLKISDFLTIEYTKEHWKIFNEKRKQALQLMEILTKNNLNALLYGSICRGDVSEQSDIDLFIPYEISSFKIESALEQEGKKIFEKRIVQATPKHLVKGHIYLDELTCLTFPLTSIREREFDFIQFGGSLSYKEMVEQKRVPGVDKRLILIEPTEKGHQESPVIGYESIIARKVGVSVELVKERIRILTTRDKTGRTGVYLNMVLSSEENFEEVFKQLVDSDPIVRRRAKL
ncbi:MAG TPA: nucleotidyltransferase domain-containing protein [candidate division Zixibacteria bacterium]|nr:nucleotidyltransferase domain-containing protein [candidate division Zixibacteria bacterium]